MNITAFALMVRKLGIVAFCLSLFWCVGSDDGEITVWNCSTEKALQRQGEHKLKQSVKSHRQMQIYFVFCNYLEKICFPPLGTEQSTVKKNCCTDLFLVNLFRVFQNRLLIMGLSLTPTFNRAPLSSTDFFKPV